MTSPEGLIVPNIMQPSNPPLPEAQPGEPGCGGQGLRVGHVLSEKLVASNGEEPTGLSTCYRLLIVEPQPWALWFISGPNHFVL